MQVRVLEGLDELSPDAWNALVADGYPFARHEFLAALERHGAVGAATGWSPCHLTVTDDRGRLLGAAPMYLKSHSWGEFVFDFLWADAYRRAGLAYYPKLVAAVPFTPATGCRLLVADHEVLQDAGADQQTVARALAEGARERAEACEASSVHWLFPTAGQAGRLETEGYLLRKGCQFHWHNAGYRDFDELLGAFNARNRKKIRRERRHVAEAGIRLEQHHGHELSGWTWERVYELYASTYHLRGQAPYLPPDFFAEIAETMASSLVVFLARHRGDIVAAAICLRDRDTLYGRHWGASDDYHNLHFETCYYQGLDYAIRHGLARFDPGTQGEHKIRRGFLPVATWSAHWLAEPRFHDAVADFLERETPLVDAYIEQMHQHSPYREAASATSATEP